MKPDIILTSTVLQPCVYIFWLGEQCQYVGQSKQGLKRPFNVDHSVWSQAGFSFDRLEVFYTALADLNATEQKLIEDLAPRFNVVFHPVHKSSTRVRKLLQRCETAMMHEQDRVLMVAPDKLKAQRVYTRAFEEISTIVYPW